jgi:hypothetical protein
VRPSRVEWRGVRSTPNFAVRVTVRAGGEGVLPIFDDATALRAAPYGIRSLRGFQTQKKNRPVDMDLEMHRT